MSRGSHNLSRRRVFRRYAALAALCLAVATGAIAREPYFVGLADVRGRWTERGGEVVWKNTQEIGTVGYRVYRMTDSGRSVPLHSGWIHVDVDALGANVYDVLDPQARPGGTARIRIEEKRTSGATLCQGEWTVRFDEWSEDKLLRPLAPTATEPPVMAPASIPETGPALKIGVSSNGVYAVSYQAIASGLDLGDASVVAAMAESGGIAMRSAGESVAYWNDPDNERIVFYGWPTPTLYSPDNIFWIETAESGTGQHMQRHDPEPIAGSTNLFFASHKIFEENWIVNVARSNPLPENSNIYRWGFIRWSPYREFVETMDLDGYAGGDVEVTVNVIGFHAGGHEVVAWVNDVQVGSFSFSGWVDASASFTVPESVLALQSPPELKLNVTQSSELVFIVSFDVRYDRFYAPASDLREAEDGEHERLNADRYADPLVFDVTDRHQPVRWANVDGIVSNGWSWAAGTNTQWVLRERDRVVWVDPVPGGFGEWMLDATNAVDYLVITARELEAPARRLANRRHMQGLRTAVAFYDEICDQFNAGLSSPHAIREFLRYTRDHWQAAPWLVVLGGAGHTDYWAGTNFNPPNPLPPLLTYDGHMHLAADARLADVTGNGVPNFALGRIPARNVQHFDDYINKLEAYEDGGPTEAHGLAVFFTDKHDPDAGDFAATNEALKDRLADRYSTHVYAFDDMNNNAFGNALRGAIQAGSGLVHFTGHASLQSLTDVSNILTVSQVEGFNDHPPVPLFTGLTCYMGNYGHEVYHRPGDQKYTLAEALVLRPNGGALSVVSSTGLSENNHARELVDRMYRQHGERDQGAVGPVFQRARVNLGVLPPGGIGDTVRLYNLLGDPALKLKGGEGGMPAHVDSFAAWRWERFAPAELADPEISGKHADPDQNGLDNFTEYAFGGHVPGLDAPGWDAGSDRFTVSWLERKFATDLDYSVLVSTNLVQGGWMKVADLQGLDMEVARADRPDGVLRSVQAFFSVDADAFFVKLNVETKK